MIQAIARLIVALNGNVKKSQLAAGFAWGLLLALPPTGNILWIVLFAASFLFRHNHAAKVLTMAVLKLLSPLIAPLVDLLGWEILHIDALRGLFTTLYNMPFVPYTRFYNTLVAGGILAGFVLWGPVFGLFMALIPLYRNTFAPKLRNAAIFKAAARIPFLSAIARAVSDMSDGKVR
ncbi:MAG: TIGR03546 family protein [Spirochaetaceae bacterium]|jgi:uncharacterized protein (TIGR03546 family)|nr:TIGR03546 family protein [Spirochaetaceae bacterium]